jgi:hypothetical protein
MSKCAILLLIAVLAVLSLLMVEAAPASASTPNPAVPEFTLKYVDYSYDVPPKTTSTTDPCTSKTTTTTVPGYHVENKTIEATIKNNLGASYYNFRYKGSYGDEWSYHPFDPDSRFGYSLPDAAYVPYKASNSSYTVAALPSYFFKDVPEGGEVDVQVQALFGDFDAEPWGHLFPPEPTYDFDFTVTTSDWSETQTIAIGESQTSPPEQVTIIIGVAVIAVVFGAALGFLVYLIKRK